MKDYWLNEAMALSKFIVVLSNEIKERINDIDRYNRNNIEAPALWHDYLDRMVSYISNPVIAWDNMNSFSASIK